MAYNNPPKRPTPPSPINYNYTRTPPSPSADQMIAAQQAKMAAQRQKDHMQYQSRTPFAADAMMMGQIGIANDPRNMMQSAPMPQIPMPRQGMAPNGMPLPYPSPGRQALPPSMPTMPPGYDSRMPYDGISVPELRAPYRPGVAPIPGMKKGPMPDIGDMTDEEMQALYLKLSGMGAFDQDGLEQY